MITSRLFGGLGNQLFQYAAGRALAAANEDMLQLDARLARPGSHGNYALGHFDIAAAPAPTEELPPGKDRAIPYILWRLFGQSPKLVRERGLGYHPDLFERSGPLYLHGYWQSEKYFTAIEPQLRKDLNITTPPSAENVQSLKDIAAVPSVSVHLRRGDYVSGEKNGATYATCDAAYYDRALDLVAGHADVEPVVFVFSDDPAWARDNLKFRFETRFIGHNGPDKHYEDMRLISACQHNVTANSTFSWWGAWLNANPQKCVVAPARWFNSDEMSNPDIVPDSWLRT